jgi:hypothetical protein
MVDTTASLVHYARLRAFPRHHTSIPRIAALKSRQANASALHLPVLSCTYLEITLCPEFRLTFTRKMLIQVRVG